MEKITLLNHFGMILKSLELMKKHPYTWSFEENGKTLTNYKELFGFLGIEFLGLSREVTDLTGYNSRYQCDVIPHEVIIKYSFCYDGKMNTIETKSEEGFSCVQEKTGRKGGGYRYFAGEPYHHYDRSREVSNPSELTNYDFYDFWTVLFEKPYHEVKKILESKSPLQFLQYLQIEKGLQKIKANLDSFCEFDIGTPKIPMQEAIGMAESYLAGNEVNFEKLQFSIASRFLKKTVEELQCIEWKTLEETIIDKIKDLLGAEQELYSDICNRIWWRLRKELKTKIYSYELQKEYDKMLQKIACDKFGGEFQFEEE